MLCQKGLKRKKFYLDYEILTGQTANTRGLNEDKVATERKS